MAATVSATALRRRTGRRYSGTAGLRQAEGQDERCGVGGELQEAAPEAIHGRRFRRIRNVLVVHGVLLRSQTAVFDVLVHLRHFFLLTLTGRRAGVGVWPHLVPQRQAFGQGVPPAARLDAGRPNDRMNGAA